MATWDNVKKTSLKKESTSTPSKTGKVVRKIVKKEAEKATASTAAKAPRKPFSGPATSWPEGEQKFNKIWGYNPINKTLPATPPGTPIAPPIPGLKTKSKPITGGSNYNPQKTASPLKTGSNNAYNPQ